MLLFLVTLKTLHNNVINLSNESEQEVKRAESSITILVTNECAAKKCCL